MLLAAHTGGRSGEKWRENEEEEVAVEAGDILFMVVLSGPEGSRTVTKLFWQQWQPNHHFSFYCIVVDILLGIYKKQMRENPWYLNT